MNLVRRETINNALVGGYWDGTEAWATGCDIGTALGYTDPIRAISQIHERHKNRLDQFSRLDGEKIVYSLRGVFEICRWSTQPKADEVMDMFLSIVRHPKSKIDYTKIAEISLNKRNMTRSEYYSAILEAANGNMTVVRDEMKVRDAIMEVRS